MIKVLKWFNGEHEDVTLEKCEGLYSVWVYDIETSECSRVSGYVKHIEIALADFDHTVEETE